MAIVPLSQIPPVGLCCQKQAFQAGIKSKILHLSVFCEMQSPIPAGDSNATLKTMGNSHQSNKNS